MEEEAPLPPGLLPLPAGWRQLDKDAVRVMDRYLPRSSSPKDLIQWPVSAPDDSSSSSSSAQGTASAGVAPYDSSNTSSSQSFCDPVLGTLRSKHSKHEAFVFFHNQTPHDVRLLWVDYQGHEVAYDVLRAGHSCVQHTFATHPWVVREVKTATRLLFNGREAFCPRRVVLAPRPQQQPQQQGAPAAPAAAPAGSAAEQDPQGGQQQQQQQAAQPDQDEQHPRNFFEMEVADGVRQVSIHLLQRADITELPALPWSETTHKHFPSSFKAAVRTFLLCHLQLQQSLAAGDHSADAAAAFNSSQPPSPRSSDHTHLGHIPALLLTHIVSSAAPFTPQHMDMPAALRPAMLPTLLPEELGDEPPEDWPHAQFDFNFDEQDEAEEWSDDDDEDEVDEGGEGEEQEQDQEQEIEGVPVLEEEGEGQVLPDGGP